MPFGTWDARAQAMLEEAVSTPEFADRFSAKVRRQPEGCWMWTGAAGGVPTHRYGSVSFRRRTFGYFRSIKATHLVMFWLNGEWPTLHVLHSCDNTLCVRPSHLHLGTHQENMAEMADRKRQPHGEMHRDAVLTANDVLAIRAQYVKPAIVGRGHKNADGFVGLGARFGVSKGTIQAIIERRSWAHL